MTKHTDFFQLSSDTERWTLYERRIDSSPLYEFVITLSNQRIHLIGVYIKSKEEYINITTQPLKLLSLNKNVGKRYGKRSELLIDKEEVLATFSWNDSQFNLISPLKGDLKEWNEEWDEISLGGTKQKTSWISIIDGGATKKMKAENDLLINNWNFTKI